MEGNRDQLKQKEKKRKREIETQRDKDGEIERNCDTDILKWIEK